MIPGEVFADVETKVRRADLYEKEEDQYWRDRLNFLRCNFSMCSFSDAGEGEDASPAQVNDA